jgi:hypothetical protein
MQCQIIAANKDWVEYDSPKQRTEWYNLDARKIARTLPKKNEAEFSRELEEIEARNAELVTELFIARDKYGVPLVAYLPGVLHSDVRTNTFNALSEFIDTTKPKPKGTKPKATDGQDPVEPDICEVELYEPTLPTIYDQRHPPNSGLAKVFGHRFRLLHLGVWHATGHAHEPPLVSRDFIGTAGRLSRTYSLFQSLAELTDQLCVLFAAFDIEAWSSARRFMAGLNHFHLETNICKTSEYECWAHRALLFNQETRTHRDCRDAIFGYTVIVAFGSFIGGEFVLPQLGLKFPHQPGDVIFVKGQLLQHFVTQWKPRVKGGERFCITHFTHQNLIDSVEKQLEEVGLLDKRFSGKTPKAETKRTVNSEDTGTRKNMRSRKEYS